MTPWCEAYVPVPVTLGGQLVPCKMPSVAAYRFRCIYGHELTRAVCERHDPIPGEVGCKFCLDVGREEPMTWQVVELAAGPAQ